MLIHRKPVPPSLKEAVGATVEPERTYVYTADDERIWQIQAGGPLPPPDENDPGGPEYTSAPERITLRDLAGKVLRQYDKQVAFEFDPPDDVYAFPFTGTRDSIHRDGQLAATQTGTWWITHQHLDHLGTPRAISDGSGALIATHKYAPYGKEIGASTGNALQFTGHERDAHGAGEDDNLDYMHARHYSVHLGRFLSIDPAGSMVPSKPQTQNRYSYAASNPLRYIDPDGEFILGFTGFGNNQGGVTRASADLARVSQPLGAGATRVFKWQQSWEAVRFALERQSLESGQINAIYGHSLGAGTALRTAERLNRVGHAISVDLLVTIDAVDIRGIDRAVPPNVATAVNFFQTKAGRLGGELLKASDPTKTRVVNVELDVGHTGIDEAVAASIVAFIVDAVQVSGQEIELKTGLQFIQGHLVRIVP